MASFNTDTEASLRYLWSGGYNFVLHNPILCMNQLWVVAPSHEYLIDHTATTTWRFSEISREPLLWPINKPADSLAPYFTAARGNQVKLKYVRGLSFWRHLKRMYSFPYIYIIPYRQVLILDVSRRVYLYFIYRNKILTETVPFSEIVCVLSRPICSETQVIWRF